MAMKMEALLNDGFVPLRAGFVGSAWYFKPTSLSLLNWVSRCDVQPIAALRNCHRQLPRSPITALGVRFAQAHAGCSPRTAARRRFRSHGPLHPGFDSSAAGQARTWHCFTP